jgi:hypothetical protein
MRRLKDCFSRLLIDNHISDIRPEYMSRFSPEEYVRKVKTAGAEVSMVYACDHIGNCYYPTQVGHMHAGLQGKDIFGAVVNGLRENDIVPIAYYTVNYHNDCARRFPAARLRDAVGQDHEGRYHYTCPNQPEAEQFYKAQIGEILQYPVAGIFIDMTFWPALCCCDACRHEFGEPLPEYIDWDSPKWVRFQRFRERSLADFARRLTEWAKSVRPDVCVTHQFSPVLLGWYFGQSSGIAAVSDHAGGDFYGGKLQQRFAVKAFDAYTKVPPFEFMTSRCVNLYDHTSTKSDDELFLSALTTLANGGAYLFIDAINPDGTLEPSFYQRLECINSRLAPFRKAVADLQGRISAETAIYFSMASCVDRQLDGVKLTDFSGNRANNMQVRQNAVTDECLGTAEVLNRMHVPWKILTDVSADFSGLKTVIMNNAAYLSKEECDRIRSFVKNGGTLIATGTCSLYDTEGKNSGNFALSDVFGIDFTGTMSDRITYTGEELISAEGKVPLVKAHRDTEIRSLLTFPDFPAFDPEQFASIHSNPPSARKSVFPAVTLHNYGSGQVLWLAAPIAVRRNHTQIEFLKKIYREHVSRFIIHSENLPEMAEVTLLKNKNETLLTVVNLQDDFPVIPLGDVKLEISWAEKPSKLTRVSDRKEIPVNWNDGILKIDIPGLHFGEFILIQ